MGTFLMRQSQLPREHISVRQHEDFLAGLKDAWKDGRFRTAIKPTRTYRTRADPFDASASDLEHLFETALGRTARDLFDQLLANNPGVYTVQQFRTFQRRQKQWRAARADAMILQPAVD